MLTLRLPDGATREAPEGALPRDIVASIGPRLLRDAIAVQVDGEIIDLNTPLRKGGAFRVLTEKDPESLAVLRHSGAHILATAVRRLRPDAKIGFGPAIEDGFYYDFEVAQPFTPEDLEKFESEMKKVIAEKYPFAREEVSQTEARKRFSDDPLKLERLSEFPEGEIISTYTDGPFIDLCKGPHVPDTSYLKNFKLLHTAGAYWRGDERRQLDLYSTDPRVGPGLILWHPRGSIIRNEIEEYEKALILRHGYDLVFTPHIMSEKLFQISGHLENFKENMFASMDVEGAGYRPKPMNCPGHICIYQSHPRSYRDLPIRYAEFGAVYRYERSGVLHGMMRVRGFTQDDAHIFCTPEQVPAEIERLLDLCDEMLKTFGYPYSIELATRPDKALGSPEVWKQAEKTLADVLTKRGQEFTYDVGGGAFYGPKLDFKLIDAIGRKWQGPTVQLDFNLPERFGLEYTGADNTPHRPIMLHRVLVGSMERFVGGLIEHFAGAFPLWLAPEQVRVIPIADELKPFAQSVAERLKARGVRVHVDDRSDTLNYRIREGEMLKIPYMAVVGKREAEADSIALRVRGAGKKQEIITVADFAARLEDELATRALKP